LRQDAEEEHPVGILESLCMVGCHPVRLKIMAVLYDNIEMGYSDLARAVGVSENLLNHHLKRLKGLVEKSDAGYRLTWRGRIVWEEARRLLGSSVEALDQPPNPLEISTIARRIAAFVVDIILFFIATGAVLDGTLLHGMAGLVLAVWSIDPTSAIASLQALVERSLVGYSNVFFASYIFLTLMEAYKGQTPGKHLLGLRVVKIDGSKPSLVEAGIRNAGKIFLLPVDLLLGLALYRKKGFIRFTEYYTGTIVVREGLGARR